MRFVADRPKKLTKFITLRYSKRNSSSPTPSISSSPSDGSDNSSKLLSQLTNARESINQLSRNKHAKFLEVYVHEGSPTSVTRTSSPSTYIHNLESYQGITPETEQQWKENAYGAVDTLKTWRALFKTLDHRKRYLRRMKKDGLNSNLPPNLTLTPDTEEQGEEGSGDGEDEHNSEDHEESEETAEQGRSKRQKTKSD